MSATSDMVRAMFGAGDEKRDADGKVLPVIVSVHGGGWVYGDKERYQYYCMNLAGRGFAVAGKRYRVRTS